MPKKGEKELDLKLLIGLEESISKTIEWYKNEMKANQ